MPPERRPVTDAYLKLLADETGRPVIDEELDESAPPPSMPYLIVNYFGIGGTAGEPLVDPDLDVEWLYQVTCVGERRDQVELLADTVRTVTLGRAAGGAHLHPIVPLDDAGPPQPREDLSVIARRFDSAPGPPGDQVALSQTAEVYGLYVTGS